MPPEVEEAIDKRSSMAAVGDLNDYVKFQMGQGMEPRAAAAPAAWPPRWPSASPIAQQMMQQQGGDPRHGGTPAAGGGPGKPRPPVTPQVRTQIAELLTPAQVAQALGVGEADVLSVIESGELKAKKIGSAYRIKRPALDAFLAD